MNTESPFAHRIARTPKRPAKLPTLAVPAESHDDEHPAPEPAPVAAAPAAPAPAAESPMRQAMLVLAAFVVTTFVMILAVLAWQVVLAK